METVDTMSEIELLWTGLDGVDLWSDGSMVMTSDYGAIEFKGDTIKELYRHLKSIFESPAPTQQDSDSSELAGSGRDESGGSA